LHTLRAAGLDGIVNIWEPGTNNLWAVLHNHYQYTVALMSLDNAAAKNPTGDSFVVNLEGEIKVWDAKTNHGVQTVSGYNPPAALGRGRKVLRPQACVCAHPGVAERHNFFLFPLLGREDAEQPAAGLVSRLFHRKITHGQPRVPGRFGPRRPPAQNDWPRTS
jgi:hypothetical protein